MTRWRAESGDLFEPQQPTGAVLAPQKAAAIKLLAALLTEALRSFAEQAKVGYRLIIRQEPMRTDR